MSMHSAPPLKVAVRRHGVWRTAVALLAVTACASMLAWWSTQPLPVSRSVSAAAWIVGVAVLVCSAGLLWAPRRSLRWDRQQWWVASDGVAERAGELALAIDLGGWMLLRFKPDRAASDRGGRWSAGIKFYRWVLP